MAEAGGNVTYTNRIVLPLAGMTAMAVIMVHVGVLTTTLKANDVFTRLTVRHAEQTLGPYIEQQAAWQQEGRRPAQRAIANTAVVSSFAERAGAQMTAASAERPYFEIVWDNGRPVLFTAAPDAQGKPVVYHSPLTAASIESIGAAAELDGLHLLPPEARSGPNTPVITVADSRSQRAAAFKWSVWNFANSFAGPVILPAWFLTFILVGAGYWFYRQTRRLTQSLVASEEHAQHQALHDPMTGLANRALFSNRLDLALEQRRRSGGVVGVFMVDLDRFKQVNDSLGHPAGDELIRTAARRLLSICRTTDTVARLGGDELALVALLPTNNAAAAMARRACEALSGQVEVPGGTAKLSASIGVALVDEETTDGAEAVRRADLALYRAKEEGRGRYSLFEQAMDESMKLRRATEVELRAAIAEGQIEVFYQPQFTAKGGKLESVEALARWNHPTRGSISPAYFVPIAEESGLIHELGELVMRRALLDARQWGGLKVAVNVSPVQLRRGDFADICRRLLDESGVEASRVELEITEGVLLDPDNRSQETLNQLRDMGFKLALDDFGTGYSSLSYLNAYPVDKIKIDRSFVSALGVQEDAAKVVRAIVRLGKALGLQVTAEGVETEAQRNELLSAGCTVLQGFLEAKPAEASAIDQLVASGAGQRAA